jgi:GH18 family chitinase
MSYFNMMTYDFNGGWSNIAGHNAPLYDYPGQEVANFSWNACYNALIGAGVPASKINMGAPFYGRGVNTAAAAALNGATVKTQRTVDPDGPISTAGDYTNWASFDATPNYEYIRQQKASWTEHWDDNAKVPYLTKGNYFLSYDNEQSIGLKAQYIVDKGLAGTIVWTVFGDLEVSGTATAFGPKLVRYSSVKSPLVNKINEVFALGNTGMPTVSITSPTNGTTVTPGASVTVNATASDSNGSITKVEFLLDGTKVGEDTSSPYSFTITSLAAGTHSIVAKATDNSGNTATATVSITASSNAAPVATITSPSSGASFTAGASITINATATDNGSVTKVEFYNGAIKLGEDTSSPYSFTWSNVAAGTYSLTAVATDNEGATGTSAAVSITVTGGGVDTCPGVATWDAAGVYTNGMQVKYNGIRYQAKWWTQNENPETHSGESGVWTNVGTCGTSNNNGTPVATITSPASGSAFVAPASVSITATATDSDGTIAKVEFFNGGTKLGEDTSSPYTYTWSGVTAGTYAITAVATDNSGATGTSASVSITVSNNSGNTSNFKVVGYMPSWAGTADAIQYSKLTHIIYAFIRPTTTGGLTAVDNGSKLSDIVSRAHAANVKVSIAVGGWSDLNNGDFQSVAGNATYRTNFINALVSLINTYQLDGVDIDWEYPIDGQDPNNFATLMTELGNAMHSRGKILTAAVSAQGYYAGGILSSVFNAVDFLNLMVYDGGNGADHSPYSYAVTSLDYWLNRGLPASKATLGVPFYSRPSQKKYYELIAQGADPNADVFQGDYYNGINTIKAKTNLAFDRGIAGMMIWEISQDATGSASLLSAIKQVVDVRSGGNNNNPAPAVSLTAPASGSTYNAPATVTISANASDNGSVAKVEFYQGSTKLGEDTAAPYAYTWTGVGAGSYSITARATDNEGASTTSSSVNITVNGTSSGCSSPQYVENNGYVAGSQVKNAGSIYQCREWPNSGWCNGAAWAYGPGTGTYWQDAWTLVGPCASAAALVATEAFAETNAISYAPNPFTDKLAIDVTLDAETDVTLTLYDFAGQSSSKVFQGRKSAGNHHFDADASALPKGLYILKVDKVKNGVQQPGYYIHLVKN